MSDKNNQGPKSISPTKTLTCIIGRNGQSHWLDFDDICAIVPDENSGAFSEVIFNAGASVLVDLDPDSIITQFTRGTH